MADIEEAVRGRLRSNGILDCTIHWSRNKEHLRSFHGQVNQHPGCCMIEVGDPETAKRARVMLKGMEFDGRPARASCISGRRNRNRNRRNGAIFDAPQDNCRASPAGNDDEIRKPEGTRTASNISICLRTAWR
ncbi:hypothetical protein B0T14DRAFT_568306 [Immersiella caudata]|uniref:RRM domain-containing protein n=1 Tax=Immersiella caudata TaxID=314043 RepID=A0AA39WK08_9PEZI|nr:hypothetical protein B0T14DRAFT_568306 [Immersiella caudata]